MLAGSDGGRDGLKERTTLWGPLLLCDEETSLLQTKQVC